jgi:hypothetical protein
VRRAVHWLESMFFVIVFQQEHILFILVPMARDTPELRIEEVWCDDFTVASDSVLSTQSLDELIVDVSTVRIEESATR